MNDFSIDRKTGTSARRVAEAESGKSAVAEAETETGKSAHPTTIIPAPQSRRMGWLQVSIALFAVAAILTGEALAQSNNFTSSAEAARKFGVHEVVLTGRESVDNPFDAEVKVTFLPPSGEASATSIYAFYDGNNTWRARVYVSEVGAWRWKSICGFDQILDGRSGEFTATDSLLRGRLLPHTKNARHWMTENEKWFLNLNDTAYFLLSPYAAFGEPVKEADVKAYVRDAVDRGITSIRCFTLIGPQGYLEDSKDFSKRWRDSVFDDDQLSRLRLEHFRVADDRLRWMLDEYPDVYVQFILFPRGSRYRQDVQMWQSFTQVQKVRVLRNLIARFAAYPQVFWLVANDAHYGPTFPNNNAYVREVGNYFRQHDPWQHPMATGHARKLEYYFGGEDWSTYVHLEDNFDVGATQYAKYHQFAKPIFLGEDRYEQDHPEDRDPHDMRYFQRRLFWSWLISGGSTNYGGRWWVVHPYSQTGQRPATSPWSANSGGEAAKATPTMQHTQQLVGLDSVKVIRDYFSTRGIELSDFEPDHALVSDPGIKEAVRAPRLARRAFDEFLIYHPNATADDRTGRANPSITPSFRLDLKSVTGKFSIEWTRAIDGEIFSGGSIDGGQLQTLTSPWRGADCIVRLLRTP